MIAAAEPRNAGAMVPVAPGSSSGVLAVYEKITDIVQFVNEMAESTAAMIGCDIRSSKAYTLMLAKRNMDGMDFIQEYYLIQNKPVMRADAMLANFRTKYGGDHEFIANTPEEAAIALTDAKGIRTEWRLTWQEAQQELWPWKSGKGPHAPNPKDREPAAANLKDNWSTPRGRMNMLWWRNLSTALDRVCPELVKGLTPSDTDFAIESITSTVTTNGQPRKTASDILAEQKAKQQEMADGGPQATGQVATEGATVDGGDTGDDALGAEFEVQPAAATAEAADANTRATSVAEDATGTITEAQREEIKSLAEYLEIPHEKLQEILAKRGVQSFRSLSREQAEEILGKFRAFARQKRAAEGSSGN